MSLLNNSIVQKPNERGSENILTATVGYDNTVLLFRNTERHPDLLQVLQTVLKEAANVLITTQLDAVPDEQGYILNHSQTVT